MYIISDRSFFMRWEGWGREKNMAIKGGPGEKIILGLKCFFVEGGHL